MKRYNNSISDALKDTYPNIGLDPKKFVLTSSMSSFSHSSLSLFSLYFSPPIYFAVWQQEFRVRTKLMNSSKEFIEANTKTRFLLEMG